MILVDTGPFVALFDPADAEHTRCQRALRQIRQPLVTTLPVLTEAIHMLTPGSPGALQLRQFLFRGGCSVWFLGERELERCFDLMEKYADHPMDLADASLITAAE